MNLFEIAREYQDAMRQLEEMESLDATTIADTMEAIEAPFEEKAVNVAAYIRNMNADLDAIKEAEANMKARRQSLEKRIERYREYLRDNMLAVGKEKIWTPGFEVHVYRHGNKVIIDQESMIPEKFYRTTIKKEVSKTDILKAGGCPGAHIETNYALTIK